MNQDDELIAAYLDDSLTQEQGAELQTWLRADPENVKKFTTAIARDEQLRSACFSVETLAAAENRHEATARIREESLQTRKILKWAVAASLAIAIAYSVILRPKNGNALTLAETDGLVSMQLDGSKDFIRLNPGEVVSSGSTLKVEGVGAQARLSYADGSILWLSGGTKLELTNFNGKTLTLQAGTLRANVLPQPAGRPLTVRTATAEATVLETSFALTAAKQETQLLVNKGVVSLQRLSDEQTLTVNANEQTSISQIDDEPVHTERSPTVPDSWIADPSMDGDAINATLVGTWDDARILTATPESVFLKKEMRQEVHYRAGVRKCYPGLVTMREDSVVRIRFRVNKPINLGLFISTHLPSWDFSGNFRVYIETPQLPADSEGWRSADVSVQSLIPMTNTSFQPGCVVSTLIATTFSDDVELEVAEFEVSVE